MRTSTFDIWSIVRYILIAVVVFVVGTQGLLNAIPYSDLFANVSYYSQELTGSILRGIAVQVPGSTVTGGTLSAQDLIISGVITIVVNVLVVLAIAFVQILFIGSVIVAILGALVLSQNRGLLETLFLVVGFAIPLTRKHWGTVYDEETNIPIPFAVIRLNQVSTNNVPVFVLQANADLDGRYRIRLPKGSATLALFVKAPGYREKVININSLANAEVVQDVGLVRLERQEKRSFANRVLLYFQINSTRFTNYLFVLSFAGLVLSLINAFVYQRALGFAGIVLYTCSCAWNTYVMLGRSQANLGKVIDGDSGQPVQGAFVKLFYNSQPVVSGVTDSHGVVRFSVIAGTYDVEVTKLGYMLPNAQLVGNTRVIKRYIDSRGYFTKELRLAKSVADPASGQIQTTESGLMNPFS